MEREESKDREIERDKGIEIDMEKVRDRQRETEK